MKRLSTALLAVPLGLLIGLAVAGVPSRAAVPPSVTIPATTTTVAVVDSTASEAPVTTVPPVIDTTEPSTTESTIITTTTTLPAIAPADVRLVVANASGRDNVGRQVADLAVAAGYTNANPVTAQQRSDVSVLYVRDGFDAAAQDLVGQLALAGIAVAPFPAVAVTSIDDQADLLLVIGRDLGA